jgi:hypothetical protein
LRRLPLDGSRDTKVGETREKRSEEVDRWLRNRSFRRFQELDLRMGMSTRRGQANRKLRVDESADTREEKGGKPECFVGILETSAQISTVSK